MKELELEALTDNLPQVLSFIDEQLEAADCPMKIQMQIDIAVEEIFVNIAHYAYNPEIGTAKVRVEVLGEPPAVDITFIDNGVPYDPLAKADPDVTLSAEERQIGGLGIFMVKKSMDDVKYEYLDGHNILTLKKGLVNK
ncbi:MAG: ATP-binding protein [Ruminococcus sp.]|nr:ATP-binding protein [Ruminococcus sp.]